MTYFAFFVTGVWLSDAVNEWKRGEPWGASLVWALVIAAFSFARLVLP